MYDRWKDLLNTTNTAQNEEFKWTATELKNGLHTIELDLSELEETVSILHKQLKKQQKKEVVYFLDIFLY